MLRIIRFVLLIAAFVLPASAMAQCRSASLDQMPERALIHRPSRAAIDPAPLVMLLHGSNGDGKQMLRDSHLAEAADRHGFIVVAPDGGIAAERGFIWNIPGVPTVAGTLPPRGARNDVVYLTGLADRMIASGCVDPARVYVTGLSGGGRMTSLLGCKAPHKFAAIAPVVGLRAGRPLRADPAQVDPATCTPATPISLLAFSGDADQVNPIVGGGASYWQYSQVAALRRWAALNGCSRPYARAIDDRTYEQGYDDCRSGATVAARVIRGGTHSWTVVDNEALWSFLSNHRRAAR